MAKRLTV